MKERKALFKIGCGSDNFLGIPFSDIVWSLLGSASGIGLCGYISSQYLEPRDLTLIIGSFGASAVFLCGEMRCTFAQPKNLIGGHIISAFVGVMCYKLFGGTIWLASALAVSFSALAMLVTRTFHPPGGSTALIAVIGGEKVRNLGFLYPFMPVGAGALILSVVALLVNNLSKNRRYPEYWF